MTPTVHATEVKNRRRFVRIPSHCKVSAQKIHFSAKGDDEAWGEVRNIGAGGLLFVADKEYQHDDLFKITLTLPNWHKRHLPTQPAGETDDDAPLTAVCQVTRSTRLPDNAFEIAVRFVNVYEDDLIGLRRFVEVEAERLGLAENR